MKQYLCIFFFGIMTISIVSCRKSESTQPKLHFSYTSCVVPGKRVWMGSYMEMSGPPCNDVFTELEVLVIDDSTVAIGETLSYLRTDPQSHELIFGVEDYQRKYSKTLSVDPATKAMRYEYSRYGSWGSSGMRVSDSSYRPVDGQHTAHGISGSRTLSGIVEVDTSWTAGMDTSYNISEAINFTPLNDSTLSFSGTTLGNGVLYFKYIDQINNLVVWQTHHTDNHVFTLTSNYGSGQLTFEKLDFDKWVKKYIRLQ